MAELLLDNFADGLNLRDAPNRMLTSELFTGTKNFLLTERGGAKTRQGIQTAVSLPGTSGANAFVFYSGLLNLFLCARASGGALHLFSRPGDLSGSWTDRGTINSATTGQAAFIDFPGATPKVVVTTDGNGATRGIWTLDGAFTLTNVSGNGIEGDFQGNAIALWQDRVIVAGYPINGSVGVTCSIFASAPKDPTKWTVANGGWTQQLREKDAEKVTGLGVVGGAFVAFKKESAYRLNDSSNGAYIMLDAAVGAGNPRAIAGLRGRLYVWAPDGIYSCDGNGPLENVGDKIRPVYNAGGTDPTTIVAGRFEDHVLFFGDGNSNTIAGAGASNAIVDYSVSIRALMVHSTGAAVTWTSTTRKGSTLYAAGSDDDNLYSIFDGSGLQDFGFGYSCVLSSTWLLPNAGALARLQRVIVQGLEGSSGNAALNVYKDWLTGLDNSYTLSNLITGTGTQAAHQIQALGHAAAYRLEIACTVNGANTDLNIRAIELITTELVYPAVGYPNIQRGIKQPTNRPSKSGGPPPVPLPPPAP